MFTLCATQAACISSLCSLHISQTAHETSRVALQLYPMAGASISLAGLRSYIQIIQTQPQSLRVSEFTLSSSWSVEPFALCNFNRIYKHIPSHLLNQSLPLPLIIRASVIAIVCCLFKYCVWMCDAFVCGLPLK